MTFSMSSTLRRAGAILAAVVACTALPAQATLVSYTVDLTIDSGQHYIGNFSFEDTQTPGTTPFPGEATYQLTSFSFSFGGHNYSQGDVSAGSELLWIVPTAGVSALEGVFDLFAFVPDTGFNGPFFTYDEGNGSAGTGALVYAPSVVTSVPEPASLALVGLALAGLAASRSTRRAKG